MREQTQKITAETLLITAKYDQIVPHVYSEDLSCLIPKAMKAEIHSGHLSFLEKPLDLASAMLSFLANTKSGTAGSFNTTKSS